MDPADMEKMASLLPQGEYAYCPNGSHLGMWDDQQAYFASLLRFLKRL
jgi:proline iminopeptidase